MTIVGGKWTTYRCMAEECVDQAILFGDLPESRCITESLQIHGHCIDAGDLGALRVYGSDAAAIREIGTSRPELKCQLHARLPYTGAEIVWAVRHEMARNLDDALSRRTRALILDARAALESAPRVAAIMAEELDKDGVWVNEQIRSFTQLAERHLLTSPRELDKGCA